MSEVRPIMSTPRSSVSSATSSTSNSSTYEHLSDTARAILTSICNDRDFTTASAFILEDVICQHNDNEPVKSRAALFSTWSSALTRTPNLKMDIKEACVDEVQRKVWVRSEITGLPNGRRKESIDMMSFDEQGMLCGSIDCQRLLRDDDDE